MGCVFLNGEVVDESSARVSIDDRGFLLGDGLFETMRAYGGTVFRLDAHLARLRESAAWLRIRFGDDDRGIRDAIAELIERNACPDAYVRLTLTRGPLTKGLRLDGPGEPTVLIRARALAPYPKAMYRKGARLVLSTVRQNSASPIPRHKTLNYLPYLLAKQEAIDAGAFGAVVLNERGQVTEESVSNLFIVKDGTLRTPPVHCGLLPGITRGVVLELAERNDIPSAETVLSPADLFAADECFLTNTLMEIMPVKTVDRQAIEGKAPGPVTERLRALFGECVKAETAAA